MMDRQALLFIGTGLNLQMDKASNDTRKLPATLHLSKSHSVPDDKRRKSILRTNLLIISTFPSEDFSGRK